jgi:hypothetical protein
MVIEGALGRREPTDFKHIEKYPWSAVQATTVSVVNKVMELPRWHWTHDQGTEGSCVGHGIVMERAITNTGQNRLAKLFRPGRRYDPVDVWRHAKTIDEWEETKFEDSNGTSVRAGYDIARDRGLRRVKSMIIHEGASVPTPIDARDPDVAEGIIANRWATTVDEVRTAISEGLPCAIGVNWYGNFDVPVQLADKSWWIGSQHLGRLRGGHCLTIYGASDKRQAVRLKNSWGKAYPLVWMPYTTLQRLIDENGEIALVTDR